MRILGAMVVGAISLWLAAPDPAFAQSRSHIAAAEEMLTAMNGRAQYEDSLEGMLKAEIAADPGLAQYEQVMRDFFREFVSWDAIRGDVVRVYTTHFSEAELRELTAFYSTPIGRRLNEESAEISVELGVISKKIVQDNQAELVRRILAASGME